MWCNRLVVFLAGVSAGEVNMAFIGNNEFCHYVTLGRAVSSVNKAENLCNSGDVVISPSAWCHCSGLQLEFEVLEDNKHMRVRLIYNRLPFLALTTYL